MIYIIILMILALVFMFYELQQMLNKPVFKYKYIKPLGFESLGNVTFNYCFGPPGCGKTTTLAYLAHQIELKNKKLIKKGKTPLKIYSNIDLVGIDYQKITKSDIGLKKISDGVMLFDESSISFNNRNTKSLTPDMIEFFKLHRHYCLTVYIFSQSYVDSDVTLRRLATNYYYLKKSIFYIINKHVIMRGIQKFIFIEKEKNEIIEGYKYKFLSKLRIKANKYFKFFNSYERSMKLYEFS